MDPQPISLGARVRQLAGERPDRPAVSDQHRTVTWAELDRRTNRIARGLEAAGVKPGDLVTIGLRNSVDFIEACYGLWKTGATPQPVSFRLPEAEAVAVMELAETPIVIAAEDFHSGGKPRHDVPSLLALADSDEPLEDRIAPVWKAPTSGGSTGRPKLILSGQPGVYTPVEVGGWRTTSEDVMIIPGPLYHNGPFVSAFDGLNQGAHVVVLPRFDAEATLAAIEKHRATWIYTVPTMMSRIWRLPEETRGKYDLSSLKTLWHLAAHCPPWLKEAFIHWLGPEVVMELYGGTEGQAVTVIDGAEWLAHRGSVGKIAWGEMKIVGEDGQELPQGEVGEIYMRRDENATRTYEYRGASARSLPGGWESLGDIGWFDAEGYLYLADRRSDMILVGGSNVYPAEIEAALDEHPLVQSSAVIGLPDEDLGNCVHAIVQPREGLEEADLRAHMAERLVTYKQPRSYEFVTENIRDDAGKVRRSELRAARLAASA